MRTNKEIADDLIWLGKNLQVGWAPVSEDARLTASQIVFSAADLLGSLSPDKEDSA